MNSKKSVFSQKIAVPLYIFSNWRFLTQSYEHEISESGGEKSFADNDGILRPLTAANTRVFP
jgi:hypothetical protein